MQILGDVNSQIYTKANVVTKIYDEVGRLYKVIADGVTTTYTYDANGNKKTTSYSSGYSETYDYNKNNQLLSLITKKTDNSIISSYSYTYDKAGNQTTKTEAIGTTTYTYDCLNRLEKVAEPGGKTSKYLFDAAGNRIKETIINGLTVISETIYTYNEQNRLAQTDSKDNVGTQETVKYTYDANGNTTYETKVSKTPASAEMPSTFSVFILGQTPVGENEVAAYEKSYKYDNFNQMIKATTGGTISEFSYNGDGLRTKSVVNGVETIYIYEYDKVVLELDGKGKEKAKNVYGDDRLISRISETVTAFYLFNGHGDVTGIINATGVILATYKYDAFGNITEKTGSITNPFRYAGYQYDEGTGFYYLNARMYDPATARFMQMDTYLGNSNDPLSLNLYTYCGNNPIMYIDPTGHWKEDDVTLNTEAQAQMIAITNAYYAAKTKEEKEALHNLAEDLRGDPSNYDKTYDKKNGIAQSINEVSATAVSSKGYLTKVEWDEAIHSQGITYYTSEGDVIDNKKQTDTITSFDITLIANITISTYLEGEIQVGNNLYHITDATASSEVSKNLENLVSSKNKDSELTGLIMSYSDVIDDYGYGITTTTFEMYFDNDLDAYTFFDDMCGEQYDPFIGLVEGAVIEKAASMIGCTGLGVFLGITIAGIQVAYNIMYSDLKDKVENIDSENICIRVTRWDIPRNHGFGYMDTQYSVYLW